MQFRSCVCLQWSAWRLKSVYKGQCLKLMLLVTEEYMVQAVRDLEARDEGETSAETRQARFHRNRMRELLQDGVAQPAAFNIPFD